MAERTARDARALATGLGVVEAGAVAAAERRILYAGPEVDLPSSMRGRAESIDCEGRLITPGLIDCHTHLIHAGDRAMEFELRLNGASYEEVARAGGGIVSSVKALWAADEDTLVAQALPRLDALIAEGVTPIEVKFGYGSTSRTSLSRCGQPASLERSATLASVMRHADIG